VIIGPDKCLPVGPCVSGHAIAEAWRTAHRLFREAMRSPYVHTAGITIGIPGSGKSTFLMNNDGDDRVWFDAGFTHPGQRRGMANRIRAAGKRSVAVFVDTPVELAVRRHVSRSKRRRVSFEKLRVMRDRLLQSPPSHDEGFDELIIVRSE
jgi:hypothetical protein